MDQNICWPALRGCGLGALMSTRNPVECEKPVTEQNGRAPAQWMGRVLVFIFGA